MNFSKPIDMPRGTHYGNNYYLVYSKKIHRTCRFYSNLEYYNFLSLEINPKIEKFCEQPVKIEIIQENKYNMLSSICGYFIEMVERNFKR